MPGSALSRWRWALRPQAGRVGSKPSMVSVDSAPYVAKYRTAIIACGTIGRVHARGWMGIPGREGSGVAGRPVEIGGIADTHPDARREFGDFFGVPQEHRYADYREMLDKERPDFVDVC